MSWRQALLLQMANIINNNGCKDACYYARLGARNIYTWIGFYRLELIMNQKFMKFLVLASTSLLQAV